MNIYLQKALPIFKENRRNLVSALFAISSFFFFLLNIEIMGWAPILTGNSAYGSRVQSAGKYKATKKQEDRVGTASLHRSRETDGDLGDHTRVVGFTVSHLTHGYLHSWPFKDLCYTCSSKNMALPPEPPEFSKEVNKGPYLYVYEFRLLTCM